MKPDDQNAARIPRFVLGSILLAGLVSLAAIVSQWRENQALRSQLQTKESEAQEFHQLRERLQAISAMRTQELQGVTESIRRLEEQAEVERQQVREYTANKNAADTRLLNHVSDLEFLMSCLEKEAPESLGMFHANRIALTFGSGAGAGVQWVGTNREECIVDVLRGRAPAEGPFKGTRFAHYRKEDLLPPSTYRYLGYSPEKGLFYDPTGKQPPNGISKPPPVRPASVRGRSGTSFREPAAAP